MSRKQRPIFGALIGSVLFLLVLSNRAQASAFYYEFQGGLAQIRGSEPFFSGAPSVLDRGFSLNGSFGYSFTGGQIPAEAQIGLQHRAVTGSLNSMQYFAIQAPYLIARLQLSRIFVGVGLAPWVWRRVGRSPGLDSFSRAEGSRAFLGEGGVLWPVTPQFSLGVSGAAQFITTEGTLAPRPAAELTVLMRVYFGFSKSNVSGAVRDSSNEFRGWRYPFGNELRDN